MARKRTVKKHKKDEPGRDKFRKPESWEGFDHLMRGLRNLNLLQLQLIGQIEQVGKQLRHRDR